VRSERSNRPLLDHANALPHLPAAFYEVQRSSTAVGLVAQGLGAAIVPRLALQAGAYPNVRIVPLVDPVVEKPLVLIARRAAQLSPAAAALYALVREYAGARSSPSVTAPSANAPAAVRDRSIIAR